MRTETVLTKLDEIQIKVSKGIELDKLEEKLYYLDIHYPRNEAAKQAIERKLV